MTCFLTLWTVVTTAPVCVAIFLLSSDNFFQSFIPAFHSHFPVSPINCIYSVIDNTVVMFMSIKSLSQVCTTKGTLHELNQMVNPSVNHLVKCRV